MIKIVSIFSALIFATASAHAACDAPPVLKRTTDKGEMKVFISNKAVVFTAPGMEADLDGSPDAYGPDDHGLDYVCNGAAPFDPKSRKCVFKNKQNKDTWDAYCHQTFAKAKAEDWGGPTKMCTFGFKALGGETDDQGRVIGGKPILQGATDPHPGYYVSMSSLKRPETDQHKDEDAQARQVDAANVPYLVLPPAIAALSGIQLGDVAALWRADNEKIVYAVYGDGGPAASHGEASAKTLVALGADVYDEKHGVKRAVSGLEEDVVAIVFPGSAHDAPAQYDDVKWTAKIQDAGEKLLLGAGGWGGKAEIRSCYQKRN
jgi:hypothetical protein